MIMKKILTRVKERIADLFRPPTHKEILMLFSTLEYYDPPTEEETRKLLEFMNSTEFFKQDSLPDPPREYTHPQ